MLTLINEKQRSWNVSCIFILGLLSLCQTHIESEGEFLSLICDKLRCVLILQNVLAVFGGIAKQDKIQIS